MKLRSLLASLSLVVAAIIGASLYAQTPPAAAPAGPGGAPAARGPGGPQAEKTPLALQMKVINDNYTALKDAPITDLSKKEDSLAKAALIRGAFVEAKKFEPAYTAQQPEEKKAEFVAGFRKEIDREIADVDQLIASLKAGNADDVAKYFKGIMDIRGEPTGGHATYRAPRGARGGAPGAGAPGGGARGPGGAPGAGAPAGAAPAAPRGQ